MQDDPNGNGQADEVGIMGADYTTFRQLGVCYGLTMITGGGWGSIDGKVYSNWTSDAYRQLLINLHDMYVDGVMPKDFDRAQFDDKPEYAARDTDRLGFIIRGWTSQLTDYYNPDHTFKKAVPNGEWVPVIWAKTEYGDPHPPIEDVASLWRVISLSTSCKDPIAAIRFIDYTFAGEGRNLNRLGIEGINYNIVNGKVVKDAAYRDKLKDGEFTAELSMPSFSYTEEDAPDKDVLLATFKGDQATVDKVMKLYEKAISQVKPVFQRPIPTADDGKKLADLAADHKTYRDEMYSKFINGSLDIKDDSAWKAYTDQMKALGDDQMREIFQKGVDAKK
jgi:putative aldouronate transport system substrate-binding protein